MVDIPGLPQFGERSPNYVVVIPLLVGQVKGEDHTLVNTSYIVLLVRESQFEFGCED